VRHVEPVEIDKPTEWLVLNGAGYYDGGFLGEKGTTELTFLAKEACGRVSDSK